MGSYDSCLLSCKPCEGCGQHIPKTRTYCEKCAPDATAGDGLELQSQLYALLGDRSSNPDGDTWQHGPLQLVVRAVLALPALRGVKGNCRGCGCAVDDYTAHVYGERKCCPDCDHRL